jgi:AcrR family transcriptional regulator
MSIEPREDSPDPPTERSGQRVVTATSAEPAGADDVIGRMEDLFDRRGFADTSVDELREAAGVSLRTLYRRYGSRERMVVAVLHNRAERYLAHLAGSSDVRGLFARTGSWLERGQPLGCLFLRARADHPDDPAVEQAVVNFHTALHSRLSTVASADNLPGEAVAELFVLHEGLIAAAPAVGVSTAIEATAAALDRLLAT